MKKLISSILYGLICGIIASVLSGYTIMAYCGGSVKFAIEAIIFGFIFGTMAGIMKYDGMV